MDGADGSERIATKRGRLAKEEAGRGYRGSEEAAGCLGKPLGQPGTRCGWWGTSEEGSWEDGEDGVGGLAAKGKRESWLGMDRARSEEESGGGGETGSAALHVGRATCVSLSRGRCEGRVGGELLQLLRLSGRRSVQDVGNIQHFASIFWDGADGETAFGRRRACDRIRGSIWAVADEVHSSVWVPCKERRWSRSESR